MLGFHPKSKRKLPSRFEFDDILASEMHRATRPREFGPGALDAITRNDIARLQARRFAKAMKAPLIFSSTSHSINVQKIFKIVLSKVFDLKCNLEMVTNVGEPILEY